MRCVHKIPKLANSASGSATKMCNMLRPSSGIGRQLSEDCNSVVHISLNYCIMPISVNMHYMYPVIIIEFKMNNFHEQHINMKYWENPLSKI